MSNLAGRSWYYDFREIDTAFSEASCAKVSAGLLERYSNLTKAWNPELNSEWTCRLFMAAKLVMSSTLHVNAANFAEDRNLRVVVPYLRYYSVLSLLRAVCYTLPEHEWKGGQLIQIAHGKAIYGGLEHLRRFDKTIADSSETKVRELKAERELISYRAPSLGDDHVLEKNYFLSLCTLLAEVAQFNSELFEASLLEHADTAHFRLLSDYAERIASVTIDGHYFGDREDAYRLGYIARKQPHPVNLQHFMKKGYVDDFFGAWVADDEARDLFDPDAMMNIIFDIP
ncbi:hypothetical protein [Niveibacterium sp. SC-1]|uniref:hypothetical protein n=1 Tax=Niveibacterium sp. SC-1 TaxID=3135646 RepID=UPI00311E13A2